MTPYELYADELDIDELDKEDRGVDTAEEDSEDDNTAKEDTEDSGVDTAEEDIEEDVLDVVDEPPPPPPPQALNANASNTAIQLILLNIIGNGSE